MIINHNIAAMNSQRIFDINVKNVDDSLEKLSSGLRINSGADDAAGLAVSEKMRAQIRGLKQASKNIQDAISLTQTAEGYLKSSNDVLQRMRELTVQAANGTYTNADRAQINVEIDQLTRELNRIHEDAKFNTIRLLDGYSLGQNSFGGEVPETIDDTTTFDYQGTIENARNVNFNETDDQGNITNGKNGVVIQSGANTDERMFVEIGSFNTHALGFTARPENTYQQISQQQDPENEVNNNNLAWRERSFYNEEAQDLDSLVYLESSITDPVADVNIDFLIPQPGNRVDITTSKKATESITVIDVALNKVNKQRADLGAFENRLEMAQRGVDMTTEKLQSAESRIRDADMAREFVELTKNQILSQSSSAMTAQANSKSQLIFRIIG
jgi:flagellin